MEDGIGGESTLEAQGSASCHDFLGCRSSVGGDAGAETTLGASGDPLGPSDDDLEYLECSDVLTEHENEVWRKKLRFLLEEEDEGLGEDCDGCAYFLAQSPVSGDTRPRGPTIGCGGRDGRRTTTRGPGTPTQMTLGLGLREEDDEEGRAPSGNGHRGADVGNCGKLAAGFTPEGDDCAQVSSVNARQALKVVPEGSADSPGGSAEERGKESPEDDAQRAASTFAGSLGRNLLKLLRPRELCRSASSVGQACQAVTEGRTWRREALSVPIPEETAGQEAPSDSAWTEKADKARERSQDVLEKAQTPEETVSLDGDSVTLKVTEADGTMADGGNSSQTSSPQRAGEAEGDASSTREAGSPSSLGVAPGNGWVRHEEEANGSCDPTGRPRRSESRAGESGSGREGRAEAPRPSSTEATRGPEGKDVFLKGSPARRELRVPSDPQGDDEVTQPPDAVEVAVEAVTGTDEAPSPSRSAQTAQRGVFVAASGLPLTRFLGAEEPRGQPPPSGEGRREVAAGEASREAEVSPRVPKSRLEAQGAKVTSPKKPRLEEGGSSGHDPTVRERRNPPGSLRPRPQPLPPLPRSSLDSPQGLRALSCGHSRARGPAWASCGARATSPLPLATDESSDRDLGLSHEAEATATDLALSSEGAEEVEFVHVGDDDGSLGDGLRGLVATERLHFGEGMHRRAFRSRVLRGPALPWGPGRSCVLKVHRAAAHGARGAAQAAERSYRLALQECRVQNAAREYAKVYAAEAQSLEGFGEAPEIIPVFLVRRPARPVPFATAEEELVGDFVKYSVRDGKEVSARRRDSEAGQKACAFQHWVYHRTGGNLLVTDLQGVGMKLTDVGIATPPKGYEGLKGNCSVSFLEQFRALHQCNRFCEMLGLGSLRPSHAKPRRASCPGRKNPPSSSGTEKWAPGKAREAGSFVPSER